ncbi:MAG: transporter [Candidatus Manganitrophaceae bacterium]|nr:MAG: transporter [Candidatus Manganitrophaceae bacterium]
MRKIFLSILMWIAMISGLAATVTNAGASCGSANCFLVTGTQEGIATPGQIIMDLSYRFIPMDQAYEGGKKISEAVVPGIDFANGVIEPGGHTEKRTNNEMAQLDMSYGINSKFALTLAVPFLNNRRHEHIDAGEFRNTDGTTGFGDIRLTGKYALWVSTKQLLVGGLGIKSPTGEYKLLNSEGEINEPTLMPGTGSWDGIVSAHYAYQILPHGLDAFLSGSYQVTTRNSLEYRFGNTLLLNGGMRYLIDGAKPTTLSLQVNLRQAPHDVFKGEEVPSTGGRWIYLTPGVTLQASPNTAFYAHVQLPVYQYVNEENLAPRYGLILGVSHAF